MTYVDQTFTGGTANPLTVAQMNQVRDNFRALSSIPKARVYATSAQGIANITDTTVAFQAERYDTDVIHDTSTNNDRLIAKTAGVYAFGANVGFEANATGSRIAKIVHSGGSAIAYDDRTANTVGGEPTVINLSTEWTMAVNDYVTLTVYQSSGGALSLIQTSSFSPEFWMHRISE